MRKLTISSVKDAVQTELLESAGKELLQHLFTCGATISVCAGGVRDTVLAREFGFADVTPRDWDIGVSGITHENFNGILKEFGGSRNKYGGFELFSDTSRPWEIWRQEETVGLLKTRSPFSLQNVLRSFVLNCNAIACDLDKGHIYDCGAISSMRAGEVGLLDNAIMHDRRIFAAKAFILKFRRPFTLDAQSERFVKTYLDTRNLLHELAKAYLAPSEIHSVTAENKHARHRSDHRTV